MEAAQKSRGWNVHIIGRTVISSATYSQWSQETKISMAARLGANDGIPRRWYSTSDDSFGNGLEQPSTSYLHHPHAVGNRHFWQQFSPHHPTYLMILDLWATPKQHQKGKKKRMYPYFGMILWYMMFLGFIFLAVAFLSPVTFSGSGRWRHRRFGDAIDGLGTPGVMANTEHVFVFFFFFQWDMDHMEMNIIDEIWFMMKHMILIIYIWYTMGYDQIL